MTKTEFEKRLSILETKQSGKFESGIVLTLPPRRYEYEPAYPANSKPTLFREVLDTTP